MEIFSCSAPSAKAPQAAGARGLAPNLGTHWQADRYSDSESDTSPFNKEAALEA